MGREEIGCDCDVIHEDVVNMVRNKMQEEEIYDLADFFRILGDTTRTKIMWALDESEMCVCDLAVLCNMSKSAISHQLKILKEANLVTFRREGKIIYYSLTDEHVKQIFEKGFEHILEL